METILVVLLILIVGAMCILVITSRGKAKAPDMTGKTAIVIKDICEESNGAVKLDGKEWPAIGQDGAQIPKSAKVMVKKVNGDTLVVEAIRF